MSAPTFVQQEPSQQSIRLSGVDWRTYSRLVRIFDERPGWRLTYDRGELEIMSPSLRHDRAGRFLGRLVITLTEELGLPVSGGGSVTMRRRRKLRGIEADDCFWIANAARMAGRLELDLRIDPPPDLAIESDVTNSSLNRMGIYAALRVPEVWRLEGDILTFNVLNSSGTYDTAAASHAFPWLTPPNILPFVQQGRVSGNQNVIVQDFREWIRKHRPASPP
jgi:Uma2 family endonuclease